MIFKTINSFYRWIADQVLNDAEAAKSRRDCTASAPSCRRMPASPNHWGLTSSSTSWLRGTCVAQSTSKHAMTFLLLLMATLPVFSQKYEISIELKSRNDTVILGHYFAKNDLLISDTIAILKNGKGVIRGNKKLAKGVYFIFNDRKRFDIIIGDNQQFGIVTDTTDFINRTKFTNSPENDVFYEFQRYNAQRGKEFQQLNEQFKNATSDTEKMEIRTKLQTLIKERIKFVEQLAEANNHLYVSKFLRTLVPVETHLPDPPKDEQGNITDPEFQYRWYRAHFFDNLNIFDPDMLRTPFYEDKVMEFMTRVIPQHPDTICVEAGKILSKAKVNDDIFRCVLVSLFNYYAKSKVMVHENVWVHLAEKWYIPYAWWSTDDYIETLKKEVVKKTPNLIGKPVPPLEMLMVLPTEHFKAAALDTAIKFDVHAGKMIQNFRKELLKSNFTAIIFWDYSCGHCKKFMEEMLQVYEELKNNGLSVITVQTVNTKEAKGKWIDWMNEKQMLGWTNAWSPYDNKYRELYDISSTPKLFLLDEKGEIIGKGIEPEYIKDFLNVRPMNN